MRITVDLDTSSKAQLLLSLWKALRMGLKIKEVRISPSGYGFHIILDGEGKTPLEALKIRALLDDDPYRLRYSLKRLFLGSKPDILFDEKIVYPERIAKKARRIHVDLKKLKNLKTPEEVINMSRQIDIPHVKSIWVTIFEIPDEKLEEIQGILSDIRERDPSFRFKIKPNLYKGGKTSRIGVVYSIDKDTAHRRGVWLVNKLKLDGYWVKKIDVKGGR